MCDRPQNSYDHTGGNRSDLEHTSKGQRPQRVKTATGAATLGDLRGLVSDLQTGNAPVQLPDLTRRKLAVPSSKAGRGMRAAIAAMLVALGVGIGWGLYGNTRSPLSVTADPGAKPDGIAPMVLTPPRQLQSLGPTDDRRNFNYYYRGGFSDPTSSAKSGDARPVDLAKFDAKAIIGGLRGAPETLGIRKADAI